MLRNYQKTLCSQVLNITHTIKPALASLIPLNISYKHLRGKIQNLENSIINQAQSSFIN